MIVASGSARVMSLLCMYDTVLRYVLCYLVHLVYKVLPSVVNPGLETPSHSTARRLRPTGDGPRGANPLTRLGIAAQPERGQPEDSQSSNCVNYTNHWL